MPRERPKMTVKQLEVRIEKLETALLQMGQLVTEMSERVMKKKQVTPLPGCIKLYNGSQEYELGNVQLGLREDGTVGWRKIESGGDKIVKATSIPDNVRELFKRTH